MSSTQIDVRKTTEPSNEGFLTPWDTFRQEIDQFFNGFPRQLFSWRMPFFSTPSGSAFPMWMAAPLPTADVVEDATSYIITAELPGLTAADVEVSVSKDYLLVKGEKRKEAKREDKNYFLAERIYGAFERKFFLPDDIERDNITADVAKGVLTVTLPKKQSTSEPTKKIEVKAV